MFTPLVALKLLYHLYSADSQYLAGSVFHKCPYSFLEVFLSSLLEDTPWVDGENMIA